jgi:uncharacterized protein (TIGR02118 family)
MVKVTVLYPNREGAKFDMDYYCNRHMALVRELLGPAVKGIAVDEGIVTPEAPVQYLAMGHLWFDSVEAVQAALATHGAALMADVPNYTDVRPVIQLSAVRMSADAVSAQSAG